MWLGRVWCFIGGSAIANPLISICELSALYSSQISATTLYSQWFVIWCQVNTASITRPYIVSSVVYDRNVAVVLIAVRWARLSLSAYLNIAGLIIVVGGIDQKWFIFGWFFPILFMFHVNWFDLNIGRVMIGYLIV